MTPFAHVDGRSRHLTCRERRLIEGHRTGGTSRTCASKAGSRIGEPVARVLRQRAAQAMAAAKATIPLIWAVMSLP